MRSTECHSNLNVFKVVIFRILKEKSLDKYILSRFVK